MNQSFHLFQLQKIDSQIVWINQRLSAIQTSLDQDTRKSEALLIQEQALKAVAQEQHKLKTIETEILSRRNKLEQSEANLYSGRVKVPKELQDIQNEIAAIKRAIAHLEDQQLESMLTLEALQTQAAEDQNRFNQIEALVAQEQAALMGEKSQISTDLERLLMERGAALQQVNAENLARYERLRTTKRGVAVASVVDYSCSACGGSLTPSDCQTARSSPTLFLCPTCSRIIYAG